MGSDSSEAMPAGGTGGGAAGPIAEPHAPPASSATARLLTFADRNRWWIFAAILVLYLAGFNGRWRIAPDSALYASLGRNLAAGEGFTYHGEPHDWAEPGLPLLIAASFRLAGPDQFGPALAVILATALGSLGLNYWLFRLHAGRPVAVVMTAILALCETFFRYAYYLFTDMPFLVGALAFLVGYERLEVGVRRHRWLSWVMMAAAVLWMAAWRPVVLTFAGAVGVVILWRVLRRRDHWRHVMIGLVVLGALLSFRLIDPRRSDVRQTDYREQKLKSMMTERLGFIARRALTESLPMLLSETTTEAILGSKIGIDPVVSVVILGLGVTLIRRRALWGLLIAATTAQMIIWLPRERYFLPILPLLLYALWLACTWLEAARPGRVGRVLFGAMLAVLVVPNLLLDIRFVTHQHRRPFVDGDEGPMYASMIQFAKEMGERVRDDEIVIATAGDRELSYYSRQRVIPPPSTLRLPATPAQWQAFREKLRRASNVYIVLPDDRKGRTQRLIEDLNLKPGPSLLQVPRPPEARPPGPWSLHEVELPNRWPMAPPTAQPADAEE